MAAKHRHGSSRDKPFHRSRWTWTTMRELMVDCATSLDVEAKATDALATGGVRHADAKSPSAI